MFKTIVNPDTAVRCLDWIENRGGLAIWKSINLSNPGAEWLTPAKTKDGIDYSKPNWQSSSKPEIVTDFDLIGVRYPKLFKTLHIALRRSDNGLMLKLTDASSAKVRRWLDKAGEGGYYEFEGDLCHVYKTEKVVSLKDFGNR